MAKTTFTLPVGRLVAGSCYEAQTKDAEGRPLVVKSGPSAGQPRVDYYLGIAIPKAPGQAHWSQRPANWPAGEPYWGETILKAGRDAFPQGQHQHPSFAWKITDGDSTVPNKAGRRPCEREGYPGHWVLSLSSGYAPRIYNADGTQAIAERDAVKRGYYVQVAGSVDGNGSLQQPGVFLNHSMVALSGYGPEIVTGPDPRQAGFGQAPLPPGASAVPVTAGFNPAPAAPAAVQARPASPAPAATPVVPHPAFLNVPAPAGPVMTSKANGASYEQLLGAGWTDALLREHGLMN